MKAYHHRTVLNWLDTIPAGAVFQSEAIGRGPFALNKIQVSLILKQHPELVEMIETGPSAVHKWRKI